ncbi:MAG TPA: HNH endonuclease [Isosphaeraceae bacterium]|nr:HNH endonuclease [Isosphaeraceae bacterium]
MDEPIRELVRERAGDRCEYCLHRQEYAETTHHVEHIVAKQHLGSDDLSNLALASIHCNAHKGPNLTGIDSSSGMIVPLFNPRQDRWADHFTLRGALIVGRTPSGRATISVLAMNSRHRLNVRAELISQGLYP